MKRLFLFFLLCLPLCMLAQTTVKKVLLQGFWWDYRHDDYNLQWANYLTEMAPRLKAMGIDAVWVPPIYKNNSSLSVGYAPFDHYDLGDKNQKGLRTKLGTKDEVLRMIAVLHANGIEVIEDIVLNHCQGAGSTSGAGGLDPNVYSVASSGGYKNFRYVSWNTPATDQTESTYWSLSGRWPKNYTNFYPNPANNCTTGDICEAFFGPDISFEATAFGPSSNVVGFNPAQSSGHMRNGGRDWMIWLKKQTGFDGYRWDAVKHFPSDVQEDYSWNMKYGMPDWAQGGPKMFNVAEWVGSKDALDAYAQTIQNPTGELMMGTFDFGLRGFDPAGGLYGMVYGLGNFNMSSLIGAQQNKRVHYYAADNTYVHRTVPFVNNHDTFRPNLDEDGNYTTWNVDSELSDHIEPNEPRLSAAYAVIMALDGNPQVFLEDLFDIGYNSNRYSHDPKDNVTLPTRSDIENLIWCHQNLEFGIGGYQVPHTSADYIVFERAGKALVGITDSWDNAQSVTINSAFAQGTQLRDYSGAHGDELVTVGANGSVLIKTVAVNPALNTAGRKGYSVWAPDGQQSEQYVPQRPTETIQEWELANDLGDKHPQSLTQGGAIPANSSNFRVAGKFYPEAGKTITINVYQQLTNQNLSVGLYNRSGQLLHSAQGIGTITTSYTPTVTDWVAIKVRSVTNINASQKCWVNVAYTAPATITDAVGTPADNIVSIWTGNGGNSSWLDPYNWEEGISPNANSTVIVSAGVSPAPVINNNLTISNLYIEPNAVLTITENNCLTVTGNLDNQGAIEGTGCVTSTFDKIFGKPLMSHVFAAVPNPSLDGSLQLEANQAWKTNEQLNISIMSTDGRQLYADNGTLAAINERVTHVMHTAAAGVYFIQLQSPQVLQTIRWVKL